MSDSLRVIDVSVVIPAFREEKSVGQVVEKIHQIIKRSGKSFEIVVVNDGSQDGTESKARAAGARVINHPYNIGYGAALKTGIRFARGKTIVMMDADGQHNPEDIPILLELLSSHDMVIGARSRKSETHLHRDVANRAYNWFASYACGYHIQDLTSGFKAIKTSVARSFLGVLPNTFSFSTTLTMAILRSGFSICYVPIHTSLRSGKSKIRLLQDGSRFLLIIMKIATLFSPMKLFLPVSASLFLLGLAYGIFRMIFLGGRYGQTAGLVMIMSVVIFMVGLVSEQISQLRFDRAEHWFPMEEESKLNEASIASPNNKGVSVPEPTSPSCDRSEPA